MTGIIKTFFSLIIGTFSKVLTAIPLTAFKGILGLVAHWWILVLVPVLLITWTVVSNYFDPETGETSGGLARVERHITESFGTVQHLAENCGDKMFEPRRFYDCVTFTR